jgi:thiol-disulfide isomerase/thioredoxin
MRRLLAPIPIAVLCAVVALVALLAYGLASNEPDRKVDNAVAAGQRDPAPNIELPKLQSPGTGSLADYRGQVVVVNYWASWCGPCRGEAPALVAAHKRLHDVTFVGLDRNDDSNANALAFVRTYGVPYPSLYDSGGKLLLAFNGAVPPTSLPSTIVLDAEGRVAAVVLGPTTATTLVDLVHDVEGTA